MKRLRQRSGFTILEIIIAIMVLTVGLLAVCAGLLAIYFLRGALSAWGTTCLVRAGLRMTHEGVVNSIILIASGGNGETREGRLRTHPALRQPSSGP